MDNIGFRIKCPRCKHPLNSHNKKDFSHGRTSNSNCSREHCMCPLTQTMIKVELS